MFHLSAVHPLDAPRPLREGLYKTDHPREIDRYIDFFGDRAGRSEAEVDPSREVLLQAGA